MIRELSELGKKLREENAGGRLIHNALKEEPIAIDLVIKEDGSFVDFVCFDKKLTTAEALTAKKGKARLLVDKAEEVLGYKEDVKKHCLFMAKIEEYWYLSELDAVKRFYTSNTTNGLDKALSAFEDKVGEKERGNNIAFRLLNKDNRIHEEPLVYDAIIDKYENAQKEKMASSSQKCSSCGMINYPIENIHEKIKNMPPIGDGMPQKALVSYNDKAYESYYLVKNKNASICSNCAKNYVEGLNWLISNGPRLKNDKGKEYTAYTNRKTLGDDTVLVYWTRENQPVEELDILDRPDPASVSKLLDSIASGDTRAERGLQANTFYACSLSGAAARIAVRDWIETSLLDLCRNIRQWFEDIAITKYDRDKKKFVTHYSRIYRLAACCQDGKEKKKYTLSRVSALLWGVALKHSTPPLWILTNVLKRARIEDVTPERAALIQLILNRNRKGGIIMQENLVIAENCGRLFAILENIQRAALGKNINAGIRERFFTSASTSPAIAFGRLMKMSQHHLSKAKADKPGLAIYLDKKVQELCGEEKIPTFPVTLTLEEQGQFVLGYYHQKNEQYGKSESKEILEEE